MENRVDLYGLRLTYRFASAEQVQTKDFEGSNKGERVEAFYQSLKEHGPLNYAAVSVYTDLAESTTSQEAS
jgi:hypothetical protein